MVKVIRDADLPTSKGRIACQKERPGKDHSPRRSPISLRALKLALVLLHWPSSFRWIK